ncbi:hypothetical protein OH77DRAFT_964932 [Trametes cingulata]|nr:hypothetical protein OH77DRAFT_964932 [Trametes cingulata]
MKQTMLCLGCLCPRDSMCFKLPGHSPCRGARALIPLGRIIEALLQHRPPRVRFLGLLWPLRTRRAAEPRLLRGHYGNRPIFASLQPCRTCACPS